jgi:hypothetical protein
MKQLILVLLLSAATAMPAGAQEMWRDGRPALDLSHDALARAMSDVPFSQPQATAGADTGPSKKAKVLYFVTLAGAVAGLAYNIKTTRDALDRHLEARTFPLVWQKTTDPKDKGKVSGILAATNGTILTLGGVAFARGNTSLGTFVNLLVGGATTIVGLHNRSVINDCQTAICQELK